MKSTIIRLIFCTLLVAACTAPVKEETPEPPKAQILCVTGEASSISPTSATLNGTAAIQNASASSAQAYFYYSSEPADAQTLQSTGSRVSAGQLANTGGDFSCNLSDLYPSSTYYYVASASIDGQEVTGKVKSFTTEAKPVAVSTTGAVDNITVNSATIYGYANLTADMTGEVTIGIIFSTDAEPTFQNGKILSANELDGNNRYTCEVTSLIPNTKYYYKSYLTRGNLNYFGEVKSFETAQVLANVTTLEAWSIEQTKATIGGKYEIISKGIVTTSQCFYYGTDGSDIEALKIKGKREDVSKLGDDNTFTYALTALENDTRYYYVASATVEGVTFYGEIKSFRTEKAPDAVAVTGESTDVSETKATLHGVANLSSDIVESAEFGVEYSATDLTREATTVKATERDENGKFIVNLTGLNSNTKYFYRTFVLYNGVREYGEVATFSTADFSLTVTTEAASDITEFMATLNGTLNVESVEPLTTDVWFLYSATASTLEEMKASGQRVSSTLSEDGSFTNILSSLNYNSAYYYVACAKVHDKEHYGEIKSFTTADFTFTVTTEAASDITELTTTLNGTLNVESVEPLTTDVWFLYSATASTLEEMKASGQRVSSTLSEDGSFTNILSSLNYNSAYYYVACAKVHDKEHYGEVISFTTKEFVFAAVDLGLSVKWAECNLGATKPEEYGRYYQWAGTREVSSIYLDWDNCPYHTGSSYSSGWTKYNTKSSYGTVDNKTTLEASDDVAAVNLGGTWRMPTDAEWTELIDNCTWTWTTLNGVKGYKVRSKKTGYTDNWIFLPAAGYRGDDRALNSVGSNGYYWSSSLYTDNPSHAYVVYFYSVDVDRSNRRRYLGQSVRPVSE